MESNEIVQELRPGIFQIKGLRGSSHSYVIRGDSMNVMIDSGADHNFPIFKLWSVPNNDAAVARHDKSTEPS